ncbi:MAG: ShlB/FhaC/HecB family hemolysin secretion/activation protein [Gallionella sp.]|nr:ShlB/FhaC/HecB family hemolysin secretion/activation protein [Gallionella sp.]
MIQLWMRKSASLIFLLLSGATFAQAAVDSGAILRESQESQLVTPTLRAPESPSPVPSNRGPKVMVHAFKVEGSSRFLASEWHTVLQDFSGRELTFAELQAAADRVSLHYRHAGLHALAVLPEQSLQEGEVRIVVVEGRLGKSQLELPVAAKRSPQKLLTKILNQGQQSGAIIDLDALERATLLANDLPGLKVSTVLGAGEHPGETDVVARVQLLPLVSAVLTTDNHDPAATGRTKGIASVSLNSPLGMGDQITLSAQRSKGKQFGSMGFSLPLNSDGLRAGVSYSSLDYTLLDGFSSTGGKGAAKTWASNLSYPFIRQQQTNLQGQLSYSETHLVNDANTGNISDKRNCTWNIGLNLNHNDGYWGGGVTLAGLSYTIGEIDLSRNASELAQDQAGLRRNGRFAKLSYNVARLQRLSEKGIFWLSANGQLANKNLDSTEEFSLGGANAVRAYPSLEGAGDEGQLATLEYRHELFTQVRGKVFYDWGRVRINHNNNFADGAIRNTYTLQGIGVGVDWSAHKQLALRASLAWRVGSNPAAQANGQDSDGSKRMPQFWFFAQYDF